MKLIKSVIKSNLTDEYGHKYDLYYELWCNVRDFALPFRITWWADLHSFSFLCFHFERRKRGIPCDINTSSTDK